MILYCRIKNSAYICRNKNEKIMNTFRKVSTRFMDANKDVDGIIFDLLTDAYGMSEVCNHEFDYCDALFSNGFVSAINEGKLPILGTEAEAFEAKKRGEYHHVIFNGECYVVYFTENN